MGEDKEARIKVLLSMTGEIMKTLHFLTNSEYKGKKPAEQDGHSRTRALEPDNAVFVFVFCKPL